MNLPRPLTSRNLWHWVYFNSSNSVMASAIDTAQLGMVKGGSGSGGDWKKTKAGSTDFGGYSDSSRAIWIAQQKQHIRALIMELPAPVRAMGNIMYLPTGDIGREEFELLISHVHFTAQKKLADIGYKTEIELVVLYNLARCAITHYWEAISPAIEGGTPSSMEPRAADISVAMKHLGTEINTRNFYRDWRPVWTVIINIIRAIDDQALKPLDKWCGEQHALKYKTNL